MVNFKKKLSLLIGICALAFLCFATVSMADAATYPCFVTAENGTVNGSAALEVDSFSEVVLYAPAQKDGQDFLYWKNADTGVIVSGDRRTLVRVFDNTAFTAVYGDAAETVADGFVLVTEEGISLYAYRFVPEGYSVVNYGVLYSVGATPVDLSDKTMNDVGSDVKMAMKDTSSARVGTVYYTVAGTAFSYRPFVTVADAEGETETVYGEAETFTACAEHNSLAYKDTATCAESGVAYFRCAVCAYHSSAESLAANKAHTFDIDVPAKEATCVEAGYTAHKLCSVCGTYEGNDPTIAAKTHNFESVAAKEATCYSYGNPAYKKCSACGETEGYERIAMLPHTLGEAYAVPATMRDGAYTAKNCTVDGCSYFEKTYTDGKMGEYVIDVNGASTKNSTFTVTVNDTGVYELSFLLSAAPAVSGYTGVYATNGKGSVNRIGAETDEDGYSSYKFYLYLEKGENTVSVFGQAAMTIAKARLTFVDVAAEMTNFGAIEALAPSTEYLDGKIVTSATDANRAARYGILQLRSGDKVCIPFTATGDASYTLSLISNGNLTAVLKDGHGAKVASFEKKDFVPVNADAKTQGSESAILYRLSTPIGLAAGEYELEFSVTDQNLILGGVILTPDQHEHIFTTAVAGAEASCHIGGYEGYTACAVCGRPEEAPVMTEPDATKHVFQVVVSAKAPTCIEAGYEEYKMCGLCGALETEITEVPADPEAHQWRSVAEKPGNCQRDGYTAHKECKLCKVKNDEYEVIPYDPENHSWVDVDGKEPTCLEDGYSAHRYCQRAGCGKIEGKLTAADDDQYKKLGHDIQSVEVKAPTCISSGYNAHSACTRCGYTPDLFILPPSGHDYGEPYSVAATYKSGAYTAEKCTACGDVKKYDQQSEKVLFVGNSVAHNGTTVTFNMTVPAAGVYELAFKYSAAPSGYVSVYTSSGYGSTNRIKSGESADQCSLYKFYVYLKKGDNSVTMKAQAALTVDLVTATYVAANGTAYVEKLDGVTKLGANKEFDIPNGKIVTGADANTRNDRYGVLQLRAGDTLTFTYNALTDGNYTIAFVSSGDSYKLTLTKGESVIELTPDDFVAASGDAKKDGSESALFFTLKDALSLTAGEYTVQFTSTANFVIGATYILCETHTCEFTEDVPAIEATCLSVGHEAYKACAVCGEPEGTVVGIPKTEDGHNFTISIPMVSATCTQTGTTAYKVCSVCGVENGEKAEIPVNPDAHEWTDIPEKAPTCTEDGYSAYKDCALCDAVKDKVTEGYKSEGHQWNDIPEKVATCGAAGYSAHKSCSVCGVTEGKTDYSALDHDYGVTYHVDASYTEGGYDAQKCDACGHIEKTYNANEPQLVYTLALDKAAKNFNFVVTVADAGLYEIAFKITAYPAASGYTSVYATSGEGSVVRINGSEADEDGYSLYRFYVYLEKGVNTVNVAGQGTMTVTSARLTFVTSVNSAMTESFEDVSKLEANKTYTVPNGEIVTGADAHTRNVRYGVLQLRGGDKVIYTLNISAESAYRIAFISSNDQYTMTLTKGSETLTLTKEDFVAANANAKVAGSESAILYLSKNEHTLSAGTYTVTFTSAGSFILGGIYFSVGTHTCDFVTVEGVLPTLTTKGYESYEGCSVCGVAKTEKKEIASLYYTGESVTVGESGIAVNGKTATVTVTAEKAGFYYLTSDMTLSAKAYFTAKSDAFAHLSKNRIAASTPMGDYGVTVYLKAGVNTVTVAAEATISSMTTATFTRVSAEMSASLLDSCKTANGSEVIVDHEEVKLTVSEDGTYCLGGLVKLSGSGLSMKIDIYDEAGTTLVKSIVVDIAKVQSLLTSDGRLSDGSSGTSQYLALDAISLAAGTYSVKTTIKANAGGNFINYYGIVLTEFVEA